MPARRITGSATPAVRCREGVVTAQNAIAVHAVFNMSDTNGLAAVLAGFQIWLQMADVTRAIATGRMTIQTVSTLAIGHWADMQTTIRFAALFTKLIMVGAELSRSADLDTQTARADI